MGEDQEGGADGWAGRGGGCRRGWGEAGGGKGIAIWERWGSLEGGAGWEGSIYELSKAADGCAAETLKCGMQTRDGSGGGAGGKSGLGSSRKWEVGGGEGGCRGIWE